MNRLSNQPWLFGVVLFVAVIAAYSPVWWAGYIWDDDAYVTKNAVVVGPLGLKEIWTTKSADICPLTITTFWLEHKLWGLNPIGFHIVNVLFHAASSVVLWRVLRRLEVPGAWLGAALWALHPVLVESVAWVSELKNTQATFFYLFSILWFTRWLKIGSGKFSDWNYILVLLFAAMAMASKSSTVILPVVLVLCAWWLERDWKWRSVATAASTLVFSAMSVALALLTQGIRDTGFGTFHRTWLQRIIVAGDAISFYLGKLLWPHPLLTIYPRWNIDAGNGLNYLPLLAFLALIAIFWLKRDSWGRPWFFALAYFVVTLLPVLGFIDHQFLKFSFVADHFQNLACMGPLALLGAGISLAAAKWIPGRAWPGPAIGAVVISVLAVLTWKQAWLYESQRTLWTYTISENSNAFPGYTNLGLGLMDEGKLDEAAEHFTKSIELSPDNAEAQTDLGLVLMRKGRVDEAVDRFRDALRANPAFTEAIINLAAALDQKGATNEAIDEYQKALALQPSDSDIMYDFGIALDHQGRIDDAIAAYRKALALNTHNGKVCDNLAVDLMKKGQPDEAIAEFQQAAQLDTGNINAHDNLGLALLTHGRAAEAIGEFTVSLRLNPDNPAVHNYLGVALLQTGRNVDAIPEFREALRLQPGFTEAQNNLIKAQAATGSPSSK